MTDLTKVETHFEFGRNWESYSSRITALEIEKATSGMRRLLGLETLEGKTLLDVGCGSGLHSLAACLLGAAHVTAIDIDDDCIRTTQRLLDLHGARHRARIERSSIFDDDLDGDQFDVVYSWGVLHHTGNMELGLRRAAARVRPGGMFAFALYRRTLFCPLWRIEKRWYRDAAEPARRRARQVYTAAYRCALGLKGVRFEDYVKAYPVENRGMDFHHDVHDWLGGFPYDSASPTQVSRLMASLGFTQASAYTRRDPISRVGLLGSGCDEYLFRRV